MKLNSKISFDLNVIVYLKETIPGSGEEES